MDGLRWEQIDEGQGGTAALFDADALARHHVGRGRFAGFEFLHVNARTIINRVPASSQMPFGYTVNVYRGCSHACTYCFARPTHEYLGLGIGTDFERKIVVKVNAVERLRAELSARRWAGHHIAMGTNTDPYQLCEGKYHLTRGVVEVLAEAANPFSILTKSTLVLRDQALLAAAAERTDVRVNLSIGTLDEEVWRASEPGTPPPRARVEAVRRLNDAGVPCGVLVAPVLPGLSDRPEQLQAVIDAVIAAGAASISTVGLHLRPGVKEHYLDWLATRDPGLAERTADQYRRGAYMAAADQAELTKLVRGMVDAARRGGRTRYARPGSLRWVEGRVDERVRVQMGGDRVGVRDAAGRPPPPVQGCLLPRGAAGMTSGQPPPPANAPARRS